MLDAHQISKSATQLARRVVFCLNIIATRPRDKSFETPDFWDLLNQLSSDTTTNPPHTKATLQEASPFITPSIPRVRLSKGVVDVSLFVIW